MGARDSGGSNVIISSEELSNYPLLIWDDRTGHLQLQLPIMAILNSFLFPMLLTETFLIQSMKEINLGRRGWTEFRFRSTDITVDLAVRDPHVQYGTDLFNFSKGLEGVQDSACTKGI
jgi:hypothetical protein